MPTEPPKVEGPGKADAPKATPAPAKLSAEEIDGIKKLLKEDQDAALAQALCPVSNENLGSMGKPVKVTAEGRTFYLCCENCEKDVKANAKAVVAKLAKPASGK